MLSTYILCGGLGTRLGSKYSSLPKCLININGKPFLQWQIEYLEKQRIKNIVLCTGHLSHIVKKEIKKFNFKLNIKISDDGKKLLGTGGAIKKAMKKYKDEKFFVMYGDSYLRVNLTNLQNKFINSSKKAVMTVIKNKNKWDKSNVYFEDKATIIYNKSKVSKKFDYVDYGVLAIKSEIFNKYPENKSFDLSSVLKNISIKKQLEGYKVLKRFYHIGDEKNIKETSKFLRRYK